MNALRDALLRGRRRPRSAGPASPTAYRGDGYEFAELREYAAGDDIRRIDWAASARSGTLQMRVMLEDVSLTLAAIVDDSPSMQMGRRRALADAAREAAACWFAAATAQDRCIAVPGDAPFSLPDRLRAASLVLKRGTALLVVSDFYDLGEDDGVLALLAGKFDCTALIARDPWRRDLPLRGMVRVRDAETGACAKMYFGRRERQRYARESAARESALLERFARCKWRAGPLEEDGGARALLNAFGLP